MSGFKIGSVRGIPIRIHFTFLLVLPLLAFAFSRVFSDAARLAEVPPGRLTGSPLLWGFGIAVALFVSVLLHELAHSLYALKRGGKVRDITLMMVGGVSQISEMPREPKHEAMMAFVGPLASLVIGLMLLGVHALIAETPSFQLRFALFYLGGLNLFLGFFNLLPAFPMDGGRILRALLTPRSGIVRATRTAAAVGKFFAVLFGIWGLYTMNVLLILIAVFVFMGAESEKRAVLVKSLIGQLRVRDLMATQGLTLPPDASVHEAAERMLRDRRLAFAAAGDGQVLGLVTVESVQKVPPERRAQTLARDVATVAPTVSPDDDAVTALQTMSENNVPQLAVLDEAGALIGSIDRDDIMRGLKLSELEATQHRDDVSSEPPPAARDPWMRRRPSSGNGRSDVRH
jgi:Zn-dependent protease